MPSSSTTTTTTSTPTIEKEKTRGKNWEIDDDVVLLEGTKEFGRGRWADIMHYCHSRHKCTHITNPATFQKHYNDIQDKSKSKYFKAYKRKQWVKPKGKNEADIKKSELAHQAKEQNNEELHSQAAQLLTYLREIETLNSTEHKETTDQIHKVMKEKGEERRKSKEDKFQVLLEQAEEESTGRKMMIGVAIDVKEHLKQSLEYDRELLGLLKELVKAKTQTTKKRRRVDSDEEDE